MKLFKKIVYIFLFVGVLHTTSPADMPNPGALELEGQPSEAEMQAFIENFMNNIDPETLDKLTRLGEEINKRAEQEGVDPFEMAERIGKEAQLANKDPFEYLNIDTKPTETAQPKPVSEPKPIEDKTPVEKKPVKPIDLTRVGQMRFVLTSLADNLSLIKRKADANMEAREIITPFKHLFDDMISYLYVLNNEASLALLTDKEFDNLYQNLMSFENEIAYLEQHINILDTSVEGAINPYTVLRVSKNASMATIEKAYLDALAKAKNNKDEKKAILDAYESINRHRESLRFLEQVIDSVAQNATGRKVFEDIKKLLAKAAPEYLKQKEAQEKLEAAARKDQEVAMQKRPPFAIPVYDAPISRTYDAKPSPSMSGSYAGTPSVSGGTSATMPSSIPSKNGKETAKSGGAPTKDEIPGKDVDEKDIKKSDVKDKKDAEKDKVNPKVAKKLDEIEKQFKEMSYLLKELESSADQDKAAAGKALTKFDSYIKEPLLAADADDFNEEKTQQKLKVLGIVQKSINTLNNSFESIKKELTVTLGFNKPDKKYLKDKAKNLFEEYKKGYLDSISMILNNKAIQVDDKTQEVSLIKRNGVTIAMDPYKAYILTGKGMDLSSDKPLSIDNPKNALIKGLNPSRDSILEKFMDTLKDIRSSLKV